MTAGEDGQTLFARAVAGMLRPLVKALIANGVTLGTMQRALKQLYVEVAEDDFRLGERAPTDSRISVLTGVHRKDVRAIRAARGDPAAEPPHRSPTVIATVVGRWLADPATTDAEGAPRPLPRHAAEGPSFDALAASVSRDVRPRTLLDEMERQGLVVAGEDGTVRLSTEAAPGAADAETRARFFAANLGDHMAAATENLLAPPGAAPFFERAAFYNRLSAASAAAVEAEGRKLGTRLLEAINRAAYARQRADADDPEARERIRVGVYVFRERQGPPAAGDGGSDDGRDADARKSRREGADRAVGPRRRSGGRAGARRGGGGDA